MLMPRWPAASRIFRKWPEAKRHSQSSLIKSTPLERVAEVAERFCETSRVTGDVREKMSRSWVLRQRSDRFEADLMIVRKGPLAVGGFKRGRLDIAEIGPAEINAKEQ